MTAGKPDFVKRIQPHPKKNRAQWLVLGGLCAAIAGVLTFNALRPGTAPASGAVPTTAISVSAAAPATVTPASPSPTTASSATGHPVRPVIVTPTAPAAPVATTGDSSAQAQLAEEAVPDMYQHTGTALPDAAPQVPTPPAPVVSRAPARQAQVITPAPAVPVAPAYSAPVQLHAAPLPTTTQVIPAARTTPVPARPVVVPAFPLPTVAASPRIPAPSHPTPVQVQPGMPAAPASSTSASTITLTPPAPPPYTFDGLVTGAEPVAILTAPGGQILLSPGDAIPESDLKLQSVTSSAAVLADAHGHTTTLPLKGTDQ